MPAHSISTKIHSGAHDFPATAQLVLSNQQVTHAYIMADYWNAPVSNL